MTTDTKTAYTWTRTEALTWREASNGTYGRDGHGIVGYQAHQWNPADLCREVAEQLGEAEGKRALAAGQSGDAATLGAILDRCDWTEHLRISREWRRHNAPPKGA